MSVFPSMWTMILHSVVGSWYMSCIGPQTLHSLWRNVRTVCVRYRPRHLRCGCCHLLVLPVFVLRVRAFTLLRHCCFVHCVHICLPLLPVYLLGLTMISGTSLFIPHCLAWQRCMLTRVALTYAYFCSSLFEYLRCFDRSWTWYHVLSPSLFNILLYSVYRLPTLWWSIL